MTAPEFSTRLAHERAAIDGPRLVIRPIKDDRYPGEYLYFTGPGIDDELFAGHPSVFEIVTSAKRVLTFTFEPGRPIWAHNVDATVGAWSCSYYRPHGSDTPTLFARLMPSERIESVRNLTA